MILTQGMFENVSNVTAKGSVFGIRNGQLRYGKNKVCHNSGWYNKHGDKLGWGDLSKLDMIAIAKEIDENDVFIILGEQDSYWKFVEFSKDGPTTIKGDEQSPGADYVWSKARYIIEKNRINAVVRFMYSDLKDDVWSGVPYTHAVPDSVKTIYNKYMV